jgi:NAD(P)H-nitrite reductase large subunit
MDFYKRLRVAKKATKLIVAGSSSADSLKKTSKAGIRPESCGNCQGGVASLLNG